VPGKLREIWGEGQGGEDRVRGLHLSPGKEEGVKKDVNLGRGAGWLMPVIPATWEAEIGRITVEASPGKKLQRPHVDQ
jgi:hypothetical protein